MNKKDSFVLVFYLISLVIQIAILFVKQRYVALIPVIITCAISYVIQDDNVFILAFVQAGIAIVGISLALLYDHHKSKKSVIRKGASRNG